MPPIFSRPSDEDDEPVRESYLEHDDPPQGQHSESYRPPDQAHEDNQPDDDDSPTHEEEDEERDSALAGTSPDLRTTHITVEDAEISVDVEGTDEDEDDDDEPKLRDLSAGQLSRLWRSASIEMAGRRADAENRPFRDMDTESLKVLFNNVRAEVGSR
jgi:hypothetical protein